MVRFQLLAISLLTIVSSPALADHCFEPPTVANPFGEIVSYMAIDLEALTLPSGCSIIISAPDVGSDALRADQIGLVAGDEDVAFTITEHPAFSASREFGCGDVGYGEYNYVTGDVPYSVYEVSIDQPIDVGTVVTLNRVYEGGAAELLHFTISEATTCDLTIPEPAYITPCSPGYHECRDAYEDGSVMPDPGVDPDPPLDSDSPHTDGGCNVGGSPSTGVVGLLVLALFVVARRRLS